MLRPAVESRLLVNGKTYRRQNVMLGTGVYARVHRLVCAAFHGPAPSSDHEAAHLNGDPMDNRASNLAWKTKTGNEEDKIDHETGNRGSRHGMHKLTEGEVRSIRARGAAGARQVDLAREFGVSQTQICSILRGRAWKWLT